MLFFECPICHQKYDNPPGVTINTKVRCAICGTVLLVTDLIMIKCPHCGADHTTRDEWKDKTLICPKCHKGFQPVSRGACVKLINKYVSDGGQSQASSKETTIFDDKIICQICGSTLPKGTLYCAECGSLATPISRQRVCSICKSPIPPGMHFCHQCGALFVEKYDKETGLLNWHKTTT